MADISLAISINGCQILGGDTKISQPRTRNCYNRVKIPNLSNLFRIFLLLTVSMSGQGMYPAIPIDSFQGF
jgi:hypothetical protein